MLQAAAAIQSVPTILPRIVEESGGYRIVLPGDPGYDEIVPVDLPEGVPMNKLISTTSAPEAD